MFASYSTFHYLNCILFIVVSYLISKVVKYTLYRYFTIFFTKFAFTIDELYMYRCYSVLAYY